MKVWMIIYRATADYKAEAGGEDEVFTCVYKRLDRAKKECVQALKDDGEDEEIEWAEVTEKGSSRKWYGRPTGDLDGYFDILEVEVV